MSRTDAPIRVHRWMWVVKMQAYADFKKYASVVVELHRKLSIKYEEFAKAWRQLLAHGKNQVLRSTRVVLSKDIQYVQHPFDLMAYWCESLGVYIIACGITTIYIIEIQ